MRSRESGPFTCSLDEQLLCACSPSMRRVLALAVRVAALDSTVLITGESGVGKERVARGLHDASPRAAGEFVAVNCGALTDTLLESELFGHIRGAFTGAATDRIGIFEAAHRGTLFLDEIGDITPDLQVKLLRVVQEREVRRVGETRTRTVDVRIIAATNRDLMEEVAHQRFRADLLYRLCVIDLQIPPLRERPEDLRALATDILQRTATRLHRPVLGYTAPALARMLHHRWPGNIRELEHAIERACAVATGLAIDVDDLPESVRRVDPGTIGAQRRPLRDHELAYIRAVLKQHDGHRLHAAKALGISLSTLKRRLRTREGG